MNESWRQFSVWIEPLRASLIRGKNVQSKNSRTLDTAAQRLEHCGWWEICCCTVSRVAISSAESNVLITKCPGGPIGTHQRNSECSGAAEWWPTWRKMRSPEKWKSSVQQIGCQFQQPLLFLPRSNEWNTSFPWPTECQRSRAAPWYGKKWGSRTLC